MTAKHTQGPWAVCCGSNIMAVDVHIATVDHEDDNPDIAPGEGLANATLLALAPDLLAACRLVDAASRGGDYGPAFEAVFSVIVKTKHL